MIPAARIQATDELLSKILDARIPMDGVAGDYFRYRKYIGSKDRANIAERVYTIMRHFGRLNLQAPGWRGLVARCWQSLGWRLRG